MHIYLTINVSKPFMNRELVIIQFGTHARIHDLLWRKHGWILLVICYMSYVN